MKKTKHEYGYVREPSEGQLYLMKKRGDTNWADAVAAHRGGKTYEAEDWNKENYPFYAVFWNNCEEISLELAEALLESKSSDLEKKVNERL